VFRVPSLRNVELTPPYFNDGSADTLELAVEEMGEHQIGVDLADAEKTAIADFLRTLTAPPRKPEP
jgi:cytochrome c peroxidase